MRDAVIVAAVRTPVGKRNGALAGVHPVDLSAHVLNALAERAGLADPAEVDDVIWGCVSQVGEQTFDIARAVRASSRSTSPRRAWSAASTTWSWPAASSR
jgi:acetyl-CoA acetyltransferase